MTRHVSEWDVDTSVTHTSDPADSRNMARDRACVVVLSGSRVGAMFRIDRAEMTVGRGQKADIASLNDAEIGELAANLSHGVPIATPVFDGANEEEIKQLLKIADLPETGQTVLYDGRTGERHRALAGRRSLGLEPCTGRT